MGLNSVCKLLTINNVTIPINIVFPAYQTNFAALVITGNIAVSDDGAPNTNALKAYPDKHIAGLQELFSIPCPVTKEKPVEFDRKEIKRMLKCVRE